MPGEGWIGCGDLKVGDQLREADGSASTIIATRTEAHPRGITVYNLRVAEFHTYFVRGEDTDAEPVWVHNTYEITITRNSQLLEELGFGNNLTHIQKLGPEVEDVALSVNNGKAYVQVLQMHSIKTSSDLIRATVAEAISQGATELIVNSGTLAGQNSTKLMTAYIAANETFFGAAFEKLADGTYQINLTNLLTRYR